MNFIFLYVVISARASIEDHDWIWDAPDLSFINAPDRMVKSEVKTGTAAPSLPEYPEEPAYPVHNMFEASNGHSSKRMTLYNARRDESVENDLHPLYYGSKAEIDAIYTFLLTGQCNEARTCWPMFSLLFPAYEPKEFRDLFKQIAGPFWVSAYFQNMLRENPNMPARDLATEIVFTGPRAYTDVEYVTNLIQFWRRFGQDVTQISLLGFFMYMWGVRRQLDNARKEISSFEPELAFLRTLITTGADKRTKNLLDKIRAKFQSSLISRSDSELYLKKYAFTVPAWLHELLLAYPQVSSFGLAAFIRSPLIERPADVASSMNTWANRRPARIMEVIDFWREYGMSDHVTNPILSELEGVIIYQMGPVAIDRIYEKQ